MIQKLFAPDKRLRIDKFVTIAAPVFIVLCAVFAGVTRGVAFLWAFCSLCAGAAFVFCGAGWLRADGRLPRTCKVIRIVILSGLAFFIISFIIVESILIAHSRADDCDGVTYVIVAGAGLNGDVMSWTLHTRMVAARDFMREHPDTIAILCGGQGRGETISEAEAMRRWLTGQGIPDSRIVIEDQSRTTAANISNARIILDDLEGPERHTVVVVSSDYHMFRLKALARKYGFDPRGLPAPSPASASIIVTYYIREYFAVIKYFIELTGITLNTTFLGI